MTRHNRAELPVEILRHVLEGQRLQPEFGRIRAGQQIELSPPLWRGRRHRLNRTDGGKEQNLGRIAPLSETCQDIHRRCVGPLEILDPHDERGLLGKRLERGDDLAQHAGGRRHVCPRGKRARGLLRERGQMRKPAWRMPGKDGSDGVVVG